MTDDGTELQRGRFAGASRVLAVCAVLAALGALVGGITLIAHSVPDCSNPFDPTICKSSHPLTSSGVAVLIGGGIQAFALFVIARLCDAVDELRSRSRT